MTVETETASVVYTGSGSTGPFTVPYYFINDEDLTVIRTTIADGTESTFVLSTDYTVSGAGDEAGGSITLTATLSSAYKLTIIRDPQILQETDYPPNDEFPAESHERALDLLTMIAQRHDGRLEKAVRFSDGYVGAADPTLPQPGAGEFLRWNVGGTALETIAASPDDDTFTQSGAGAVARSWSSKVGEIVSVKDFGAVGDFNPTTGSGTVDLAAIQATFDRAALIGNCTVHVPPGKYYLGTGYHPGEAANTNIQLVLGSTSTENAASNIVLDFNGVFYAGAVGRSLVIANAHHISGNPKIIGYAGGALGASREYDHCVVIGYNSTDVTLDNDFYLSNALGYQVYVGGDLSIDGSGNSYTPKNVKLGRGVLKMRYGNGTDSPSGGSRSQHALQVVDVEGLTITPECVIYGTVNLEPNNINQAVTLSNGSPCVATFAAGLDEQNGAIVNFTTTGGLPTGLSVGTNYFVINKSGDTCNLAATHGGAAINTSSAGSGVHTAYWHQRIIDVQVDATFRSGFVTPIHPSVTADYWADEALGRWNSDGTEIAQGTFLQGIDTDPFIHGVTIGGTYENGTVFLQGQSGTVRPNAFVAKLRGLSFYKGKVRLGVNSGTNANAGFDIDGVQAHQTTDAANGLIVYEGNISGSVFKNVTLLTGDLPAIGLAGAGTRGDAGNNTYSNIESKVTTTYDFINVGAIPSSSRIFGCRPNKVDAAPFKYNFSLAAGATKTVTVTVPAGYGAFLVTVGGNQSGANGYAYAAWLIAGDFSDSATPAYAFSNVVAPVANFRLSFSTITIAAGSFSFQAASAGGGGQAEIVVTLAGGLHNGAIPSIAAA